MERNDYVEYVDVTCSLLWAKYHYFYAHYY